MKPFLLYYFYNTCLCVNMVDLEDRILRHNVPGRWSSLDGENDDVRANEINDQISEEG